ncbi:MAG: hypothetical protein WAO24_03945 [Peptococcia bacterium]
MRTGEVALPEITAAFGLTINEITRKDDTWLISTTSGEVVFKEYQGDLPRLEKRLAWHNYLKDNRVIAVPELLQTKDHEVLIESGELVYCGWYQPDGEPFSGHNEQHLVSAITSLALLHAQSVRYEEENKTYQEIEWQLPLQIQARLTDLLVFSHKMAEKRLADDFQKLFLENFDFVYDQGQVAIQMMVLANCLTTCAGKYIYLVDNFLPEKIIINQGQAIFVPSIPGNWGPKPLDLAAFLRNYLSLHNWDPDLAYRLIKLYEEQNPLQMTEKYLLLALIRYPARFWLYSCQYQRQERSVAELTEKLTELIREIHLRDSCLDKLESLLSGGE